MSAYPPESALYSAAAGALSAIVLAAAMHPHRQVPGEESLLTLESMGICSMVGGFVSANFRKKNFLVQGGAAGLLFALWPVVFYLNSPHVPRLVWFIPLSFVVPVAAGALGGLLERLRTRVRS